MRKPNRQRRKAGEKARENAGEKARAKARQRRRREDSTRPAQPHASGVAEPPVPPEPAMAEIVQLGVDEAIRAALENDPEGLARWADALAASTVPPSRARLVDHTLVEVLCRGVTAAWRLGWQPADLVRYATREQGKRATRMTTDVVAAEMRGYSQVTVDERWLGQLSALEATVWWQRDDGYLTEWAVRHGTDRVTTIACAVRVIALLRTLPMLEQLCPPPGQVRRTAPRAGAAAQADQRMLDKIRALLAKAEATEFPGEAEALTARAQQLMARHSIDHALLAARTGGDQATPGGRRLPIDNPYESSKAVLLTSVARANRCRAIWSKPLGFSTVLGFPADLDAVELLFTSLLVQANTAVAGEGGRRGPGGRSRTRSFRQSFLASYAVRIGERLGEATGDAERQAATQAPGTDLLPVLAAREQAVDDAVSEMFPRLAEHRMNAITDREGWLSGRAAADRADLTAHTPALADQGHPPGPPPHRDGSGTPAT